MFAYCGNNPVSRSDDGGCFWDTVFDVVSLVASIVEVVQNPKDVGAWVGLAMDVVDVVVPCIGGLGEIVDAVNVTRKASKSIDDVRDAANAVEIATAVDFTDEAAAIVRSLDRSSGYTKSSASIGREIHKGYKATGNFNPRWKEYSGVPGMRPDYIDFDNKIIYELKPNNPRSITQGIKQLQKYNSKLGGGFKLRLELY